MNPHQHQLGITHLRVIGCDPVGNPVNCDYWWNKDCTAYRVSPLLYWDDASYADYESDAYYHERDRDAAESEVDTSAPSVTPMPVFDLDAELAADDCPF